MSEKKKSTLIYMQEMFKDKVDEDVIKLVLTECQYNVEKTVMQLLTLSDSMGNKSNVGASSSSRKFDDIDPVDTPLPDMKQYLHPDTKNYTADQLNFSTLLPKAQYPGPRPTKPISLDNSPIPGTARPMFPNYTAIEHESLFASGKISQIEPKVRSDSKLSDGFNENEMYVSDDDIDEQIDPIDCIDNIGTDKNDKVDDANHDNVKDTKIVKKVEQNVSNAVRNKSSGNQSFLNDKAFRANNPQQKQVNMHNNNRTASPHPFGPQFNFPPNQYFANQARYFSNFAPPTFSHPFIQIRGNMPPGQYHRPLPQPGFTPPIPRHPTPTRPRHPTPTRPVPHGIKAPYHTIPTASMTLGNKAPNQSVPTVSMTYGNKGAYQSTPATVMINGITGSNHPIPPTFMTNGTKWLNHPAQATTITHGNEDPNHPIPITSTHSSKGSNHPNATAFMMNSSIRPNYPAQGTTITHGNKGPNHPKSFTSTQGSKGSNHPTTTTFVTNGTKGPNHPIPPTITHGNRGSKSSNHPKPITPTHGSNGPNHLTPTTTSMAYGSKVPNHSVPATTIVHGYKGPNHPRPITPTRDNKGAHHPTPTTSMTNGNKVSDHSTPTTSKTIGYKGSNHMHRENGHSQTRMQAKFSSLEKKSLTILRGLPGSGKSTLARHLAAKGGMIISTDDFFEKGNTYCFNPIELTAAHEWNQNRAKTFMEAGLTPLIIDNTNTQSWEMRPYVLIGLKCGYKVDIKEPDTWWKWNIKELERRNTHGVTSKTLERMLERYEKNVTVDTIAKSAPKPIITPKSDDGETNGNAVKNKTENKQEFTSNGSKPLNEGEKCSQVDSKSGLGKTQGKPCNAEKKRAATTKKTISLSANFSAPLDRSKRSFGDSGCTKQRDKQRDKQGDKRFKHNNTIGKGPDIIENSADVHRNNGSNLDSKSNFDAVVSNEQSIPVAPVSSIDTPVNAHETSEENCFPHAEDMNSKNTLNAPMKSKCAGKTSSNESNSKLRQNFEIDISESRDVNPGDTLDCEIDLKTVSHEDDDSKSEPSIVDVLSCKVSVSEDAQLETKDNPDSLSSNLDDEGDTQFTSADEERVSPLVYSQSINKPVEINATSCPNNQPSSPLTDSQKSTNVEDTGIDLQADVPDRNNKNKAIRSDVQRLSGKAKELASESSLSYTDLQGLKDKSPAATTVGHDPSSADVLVDRKNSPSVLKEEHCETTFSVNSNTVEPEPSFDLLIPKDNAQQNASSGVFDMLIRIMVDPICGLQEHDRSDMTDPFNNMSDSYTSVQPSLPDLVVNPNSDVFSDTTLDVPKNDAMYDCKSNERDSCIDGQDIDTSKNAPNIVGQDQVSTLQEPSCGNGSNATIDLRTVVQSSNNDLKQTGHRNPNKVHSRSPEKDAVDFHLHNIDMENPLTDQAKANVIDVTFDLQNHDSSIQSSISDFPDSATDKNDALDPIQFLKDCFPNNEIDLLKSFLNSCNGDLLKTVECLLECNANDYQSVTSLDNDIQHEQSPRENFDNNSPQQFTSPSAEHCVQDFSASPCREKDVASRNFKTPEENWNSYGSMKVESPISASSTPKKFQDISVDSLQLTLDPALALQLLEMFGAFSGVSAKDPLSESARCIKIDKDFAKILYTKWRKTVQATNKGKKTEESKKFSPGLSDGHTRRKYKTPPRQFYLPDPVQVKPAKPVVPQPEPVSLKEIMDEQLAIHVSQSDQEIEKRFLEEQLDLSTKLKRSRLHGMFPGIDVVALNEIFQANNYDLDTTILQVQSSCGMPLTGKPTAAIPEQSFTNHQSSVKQSDFASESSSEHQTEVDGNFQSFHDPSYQDYRAEAQTHFELRTECIKKAALAYSKKQGELAKIYADQARHHGEKIKEANRRAAEKILENRNHDLVHSNTLDLHELHVNEAIQVLDNVLEERRKERRSPNKRSPSYLEVITGRGNRSRDGKPRIKPAVMDYLKRHGYRYEELNSGLYKVFLN